MTSQELDFKIFFDGIKTRIKDLKLKKKWRLIDIFWLTIFQWNIYYSIRLLTLLLSRRHVAALNR